MAGPDDHQPYTDDWFEQDERTRVRQQRVRWRPSLPPFRDGRLPGMALVAGAALLLLLIALVVVFTGGDDAPADATGTVAPTAADADAPPAETEPPAESSFPTDEIIRPGQEGERIAALQRALASLGYDPGEPDGIYGPATTEAVRRFQRTAGLTADGIAGPMTLTALNEALAAQR